MFFGTILLCATALFGQSTKTKHYVNESLGFELSYPAYYHQVNLPCEVARGMALRGEQSLIYLTTGNGRNQGNVNIYLNRRGFSVEMLQTEYAATGWDAPSGYQLGEYTFYYYGPGGGGVSYPDRYLFNLNGSILGIDFDGPYPPTAKTPSEQTKEMELEVLESFRLRATQHTANEGQSTRQ